jgi:hypothetical protein
VIAWVAAQSSTPRAWAGLVGSPGLSSYYAWSKTASTAPEHGCFEASLQDLLVEAI